MYSQNDSSCLRSANKSQGCPVPVGNGVCGETNSLEIMKQFNRLYEERMEQVDSEAGGDCLQEKVKLQQEWIRNLTQQNEMLVRAVQELEFEATERVHQLEDKLQKSAQCLCEGEKLLNDKDRTVHELTQKLDYYNSFGDVDALAKELQSRREECESLKQTTCLADSERGSLQSKVQKLQQENATLRETLTVDKTHIEHLDEQFKSFLEERDGLKAKNRALDRKSKGVVKEKEALRCQCEVLQTEIRHVKKENAKLQQELESTKSNLENVTVESTACQQKLTAIVEENRKTVEQIMSLNKENRSLSHEIDVLRNRSEYTTNFTQEEIGKLNNTIEQLKTNLEESRMAQNEEEKAYQKEITILTETINSLEVELKELEGKSEKEGKTCKICRGKSKVGFLESSEVQANLDSQDSELLQDLNDTKLRMQSEIDRRTNEIHMLRSKVEELESNLRSCEERSSNLQEAEQMKKLAKQKRCYEEVVAYFKHEMGLMADQLNNLQELLTLSNEAAQQESSKVMNAFLEVQSINEKLSTQLCACEQQVQLENQMNQLQEAKICQLQQLVKEKELDLSKHDQAILNIRQTLNDSLKQNEDLQLTIAELNETIGSLQCSIRQYEYENCASKKSCLEFQQQIGGYCTKLDELKSGLEQKTAECLKLEMAYNNEKRALKAAQKQLQETDKMQQDNQKELVNSLQDLKRRLACSDENNTKLCEECDKLQAHLTNLSRKEAVKDLEIKRYRKIVGDLKATMMELNTELNKNLAQKELKGSCKNANCRRNLDKDDPKMQDMCLSCPCEVEFYQKMVDILKKSVSDLKKQLSDAQQKCKAMEHEMMEKDLLLQNTKEELDRQCECSNTKITALEHELDKLTQELQIKSLQLTDVKKSANEINGSKCVQLACAQEEIANLKNEMAGILNRQYALKRENEELHAQADQLHCTINCLNEKSKLFKDQVDQYAVRIKNLNTEKDTLLRKNKELLSELKSIQSMTCSTDKHHRQMSSSKQIPTPNRGCRANRGATYNASCTSPCSLGSQGTTSIYDRESPPPSPDFGLNNEWYSTTFRADSDNDSGEDYCVNTLENLTQQMRNSNKVWMSEKRSLRDCRVSKDVKERH